MSVSSLAAKLRDLVNKKAELQLELSRKKVEGLKERERIFAEGRGRDWHVLEPKFEAERTELVAKLVGVEREMAEAKLAERDERRAAREAEPGRTRVRLTADLTPEQMQRASEVARVLCVTIEEALLGMLRSALRVKP